MPSKPFMSSKLFSATLVAATLLFAACSKKGPSYAQYIPKEASYVMAVDVKSMVGKLESDSLTVENMLEILKDTDEPADYTRALGIWKQFKDAGLDWNNPLLLAVPQLDMDAGKLEFEIVAGLSDAKKLEAFIAQLPDAPKVQKEKDLSFALTADWAIGWNSSAVMILGNNNDLQALNGYVNPIDSNIAPVPGSAAAPIEKLKKYFALAKDASVVSVAEFNNMMEKKSDIAIFTNSSSALNSASANAALAMMPKVKDLVEGLYSTTYINFEDGKIVMDANTFAGKKLSELLKKYAGPQIDRSMVEAYPGTPMGISAFSFKPALIPGMLAETGLDALANLGLSQAGTTVDEISKCFAGDFAVIFGDFKLQQVLKTSYDGSTYTSTEPDGNLVVAVKVGDKALLDKLLALATKQGMLLRSGNRLMLANNGVADTTAKVALGIENNMLIFSNNEATYKAYAANTSKASLPTSAVDAIDKKSVAFWMDGEKLLGGIPETIFDSTEVHSKNMLVRAKQVFKSAWFNSDNFDGKKINGKAELGLAPGKNALPQLVRFLMYVAEESKARDAALRSSWDTVEPSVADSAAAVELPTPKVP
ncbi:MAG: DUF4836 family protein [Bacteroidetes bacterium]|nr:MAG: DUF4836 family protein [Bacteroidota bacterium]